MAGGEMAGRPQVLFVCVHNVGRSPMAAAHLRRHFVWAGDANPDQLSYWTAAWLERIKNRCGCSPSGSP